MHALNKTHLSIISGYEIEGLQSKEVFMNSREGNKRQWGQVCF